MKSVSRVLSRPRRPKNLLAQADFVLGVGAELGFYTSEGGLLFPSANVARIDTKPAPDAIGILPGLYVRGDAKRTLMAINEALEKKQVRNTGYRTPETQEDHGRISRRSCRRRPMASIRACWRATSPPACRAICC